MVAAPACEEGDRWALTTTATEAQGRSVARAAHNQGHTDLWGNPISNAASSPGAGGGRVAQSWQQRRRPLRGRGQAVGSVARRCACKCGANGLGGGLCKGPAGKAAQATPAAGGCRPPKRALFSTAATAATVRHGALTTKAAPIAGRCRNTPASRAAPRCRAQAPFNQKERHGETRQWARRQDTKHRRLAAHGAVLLSHPPTLEKLRRRGIRPAWHSLAFQQIGDTPGSQRISGPYITNRKAAEAPAAAFVGV